MGDSVVKALISLLSRMRNRSLLLIRCKLILCSWQVAYVWAFIVKFGQIDKIRKLECLEE